MKKRTVLVTGSAGQSGQVIVERLSERYDVVGFDRLESRYTTVLGSLTDWEQVKAATAGVHAIIHTASLHAPHVPTHSREEFIDNNIKGTLYLLEAAKVNKVRKLVYTSTTSLYGESMDNPDRAVWITEAVRPVARDIYDITKLAAENLCRDFFEADELQTMSLRVSRFWDEPMDKKVFYRTNRGLDVRDVAQAHQLALEKDFGSFEVFNISAQTIFEETDLLNLKHRLLPLLKERVPALVELFEKNNWTLPESIDRVYVIEKAREMLDYRPDFNIGELLKSLNAGEGGR